MQPTRHGRALRISVHKCKAEDKRSNLILSAHNFDFKGRIEPTCFPNRCKHSSKY